jgi:membrane fusion protein (multidrug efflux system)
MQNRAPCRPEPAPAPRRLEPPAPVRQAEAAVPFRQAEAAAYPQRRPRRLIRLLLLVVVPAVAALFGLYWYAMTGRYVSTENAYVKADMVAVSPDVDGRVIAVGVAENQFVRQGDVLFRLDPEPFQIALDMAEAKMLAVRNDVEAARAEFRQIEAEIEEARERVQFYAHQADRQRELAGRGISTEVKLEEAEVDLMGAQQREAALQEKLRTVLAKLGGDPASAAELHPMYRQAEAERDMAALNLAHAVVRAPVDGTVSRMRLQPGEWLEEGEPAFSIINPATTWIEANLKETQLEHVEIGQQVEIDADAYPNDLWIGKVASISPATGAEFALIPPQNATGNWVKVVQRLPVRIAVEPTDGQPQLRAGMTVTVSIDTEREPELAKFFNRAVAAVKGAD